MIAFGASYLAAGEGIQFFDVTEWRITRGLPYAFATSDSPPISLAWSPDGRYIATAWGDVLNAATGEVVMSYEGNADGRVQWIVVPPPPSLATPTAQPQGS